MRRGKPSSIAVKPKTKRPMPAPCWGEIKKKPSPPVSLGAVAKTITPVSIRPPPDAINIKPILWTKHQFRKLEFELVYDPV